MTFGPQQTPYWNTTPLPVSELADAIKRADKQDEAVMAIFHAVGGELGPSQVWKIGTANGMGWVLTSVRRSMTNLADPKCGALVKSKLTTPPVAENAARRRKRLRAEQRAEGAAGG